MPFDSCLSNFSKVYNDVFVKEVSNVQFKYQLMELQLIERWEADDFHPVFRHNFINNTSRQANYLSSSRYIAFIKDAILEVKRLDFESGEDLELHQRGMKKDPPLNDDGQVAHDVPMHGKEFFFSNVMIKVYQIPMLFLCTSEFTQKENEGSFLVLVYERKCLKRRQAVKEKELALLEKQFLRKRLNKPRYLGDKL